MIEAALGTGPVYGLQLLFFSTPNTTLGGIVNFWQRLEEALRTGGAVQNVIREYLRPTSAVAIVAGVEAGIQSGPTAYSGWFSVSELPSV